MRGTPVTARIDRLPPLVSAVGLPDAAQWEFASYIVPPPSDQRGSYRLTCAHSTGSVSLKHIRAYVITTGESTCRARK